MRMTTTTRWGAALGGAALAVGLTSCGTAAPETEAADPAAVAGQAVAAQDELQPGEETTVAELLERLKSPGVETLSSFEVSMEATDGTDALTLDGAVDLGDDAPRLDLTATLPEMGELRLVVVDEGAFVSVPMLSGPGTFFAVPVEELEAFGAEDLTGSLDLEQTWEGWDVGGRSVTFVGSEDVDGTPMDHFQVLVDLDEAASAIEGLLGDEAHATDAELGEMTYDLWVDDADLMRQMTFGHDGYQVQLDLDGWGTSPQITAPDASDVVPMPSFGTEPTG
jgi:hypothetical protein